MLKEFRDFAVKGNLVEVAVAFILGLAFAALIAATVENIFTPLIAAIFGTKDFSRLFWEINGARVTYGVWLNALITFVLTAFALFLVIKAYNRTKEPESPAPVKDCPYCQSSIPDTATRCPACTSELSAAPAA
jgi:large conductance mechanosensitive channel